MVDETILPGTRAQMRKARFELIGRATALIAVVSLASCASSGTNGSSAVQAFASSTTPAEQPLASTIVDAMAGGLIGGTLGARLDSRERRRALESEYRALEYTPAGESVSWGERGGSRSGEVVAGAPYRVGSQDCRQYSHTVYLDGNAQSARGAACRNADGSWSPLA
jgi:surface antigen